MHTAVGFPALIRAFRLALTVEGLRSHTIYNYTRDAERFASQFQDRKPTSISASDIRAYVATLLDNYSPKTVCQAQIALRRFFRFLVREGESWTIANCISGGGLVVEKRKCARVSSARRCRLLSGPPTPILARGCCAPEVHSATPRGAC